MNFSWQTNRPCAALGRTMNVQARIAIRLIVERQPHVVALANCPRSAADRTVRSGPTPATMARHAAGVIEAQLAA
jgi:hypothetical protein